MNDIYKIIDLASEVTNFHMLNEALDPSTLARLKSEFATPDMRPNNFDVTFESWLIRIGTWGKTKIIHNDPEFRSKKQVTDKQMISRINDTTLLKTFGKFGIDQHSFSKVILFRNYKGMNGKKYKEEFIVTNDLSKVKQRMKKQ